MKTITPFLWFDGRAEEAAKFYVSIFERSKITGISRYPSDSPGPEGSVMVVNFQINGQQFQALNGGPDFPFTNAISFVVNCDTQQEIDTYWRKLASGGGKHIECGWLQDRFGVRWQITPTVVARMLTSKNKKKAAAMVKEVWKMKKLDLKKLKQAYDKA